MKFSYLHLKEIINKNLSSIKNKINISFEFFPTKNKKKKKILYESINVLKYFKPKFLSVTYGANSGEKDLTFETVTRIKKKTKLNVAPHITCIDLKKHEIINLLQKYWKNGIKNIIALRGDLPAKKNNNSIMYAVDLVKIIKETADFDISVAAYPEVHPQAKNKNFDLINLKKKIDAGANRAITQFFFDIKSFLKFRDNCVSNNINVDIIPGILPIYNFQQVKKFSNITNVKIPSWIYKIFNKLDENDKFSYDILSSYIIIDMIKILSYEGVKHFHFYTLNKHKVISVICKNFINKY
ncbi:methylenetetrahydrofolate reductase [Buchnera aphidicola (Taiwanaphis decaspermi)]|uniref:methylenetetrahydrofolate reductase n=1 Tax=Buchnera aphidicola TaxID=9 RepID=UPI0031B89D74